MQDKLQKEVDHPVRVFKQNDYPASFIRSASALLTQETADTSSRDGGHAGGDESTLYVHTLTPKSTYINIPTCSCKPTCLLLRN